MNTNIIAKKSKGKKLTHTSFLTFISIIFSKYFRESNALANSIFLNKQTRQRLVLNDIRCYYHQLSCKSLFNGYTSGERYLKSLMNITRFHDTLQF